MQDQAIELLVIGNTPSEVEGYLTTLRNAGIAVHAQQVEHDVDAITQALGQPTDILLYTIEPGEVGIPRLNELLTEHTLPIPLITLAEGYDSEAKSLSMQQGAADLIARNENDLLMHVIQREYGHLAMQRNQAVASQLLKEAEDRCNALTESSRDAIAYVHEGMHVKANSAYLQLFNIKEAEEIEGLPILDMIAASEHKAFKKLLRQLSAESQQTVETSTTCVRDDGSEFSAELSFSPASIEGEPCTQVVIRDQSLSKEVEEKLRLLSTQDTQTGLYNRQYFITEIDQNIDSLQNPDSPFALFYITLDNFKDIRANAGIQVSDNIISEVAKLLTGLAPTDSLLARFGDHTFTLYYQPGNENQLDTLAQQICQQIEDHGFQDAQTSTHPTCSVGVARSSTEITSANDFINLAYQACEKARIQGGNQSFIMEETQKQVSEETGNEVNLEHLIEYALANDQFRLVYQPIVSLHGDTREHYAVLVRLLDNNQEEIHPDHFLSQVASLGKMADLDKWVIRNAISELSKHRAQGEKTNFFINISGQSLQDESLLVWICDCLSEFDAKGSWVIFQIHESDARMRLHELQQLVDGLKKIKCKISIDHFELSKTPDNLIQNLAINFVQFDPSVLDALSENQEKQDQLNELNQSLQNAKIKTVAAGVNESKILAILWSIGINYIRGYFIQEPSPSINYDFKADSSI